MRQWACVLPLPDTATMPQNRSFARLRLIRMTGGRFLIENSLAPGDAAMGLRVAAA